MFRKRQILGVPDSHHGPQNDAAVVKEFIVSIESGVTQRAKLGADGDWQSWAISNSLDRLTEPRPNQKGRRQFQPPGRGRPNRAPSAPKTPLDVRPWATMGLGSVQIRQRTKKTWTGCRFLEGPS
jgi:hypothetical protein